MHRCVCACVLADTNVFKWLCGDLDCVVFDVHGMKHNAIEVRQIWCTQQPRCCVLQTVPNKAGWRWWDGVVRPVVSSVDCVIFKQKSFLFGNKSFFCSPSPATGHSVFYTRRASINSMYFQVLTIRRWIDSMHVMANSGGIVFLSIATFRKSKLYRAQPISNQIGSGFEAILVVFCVTKIIIH